jgi:hypothetical protein
MKSINRGTDKTTQKIVLSLVSCERIHDICDGKQTEVISLTGSFFD